MDADQFYILCLFLRALVLGISKFGSHVMEFDRAYNRACDELEKYHSNNA